MATPSEAFLSNLQTALLENNLQEAESLCNSPENLEFIQQNPWEIIPTIAFYINQETEEEEEVRFDLCVKFLKSVCEKTSAEDLVLVLHKEMRECDCDIRFGYYLDILGNAVINAPRGKVKFAIWGFEAVKGFVDKLPLPANMNFEEKERVLMDTNEDVYRISVIYSKVYNFYEEIIKEFKDSAIIETLIKYLLQLFGTPLICLDLSCTTGTKSRGRLVAENLIYRIAELCDVYKFISWKKYNADLDEDLEVKKLSLLNFYYLIICEDVAHELTAKIYDPLYLFQNSLGMIAEGFQNDNQFVIEKGLNLTEKFLSQLRTQVLSYQLLDDPNHKRFCVAISKVIIYSPLKSDRQKGLEIFKKYLLNFETKGRYLIISNMFDNCTHTGLTGYLTTQYKDMLAEALKSSELDSHFKGPKLRLLLNKFCNLPKKEESDLLELADLIIPTLNFMRFLAIRDKSNTTKIWDYFPEIATNYFEPIKKGLTMSKAHYKYKIVELEEEAAKGDKKKDEKVTVSVSGGNLPDMSYGEQMNVMKTSITAFDVMESLLCRVVEFVENKQ